MNIIEKVEEYSCYGCGACVCTCPSHALELVEDESGFLRRKIDLSKCINCGKCIEVCPCIRHSFENDEKPVCKAAWAVDEIRMTCASGGLFTAVASTFINDGGYVVGAVWDDDHNVVHVMTNDLSDLLKISSSKYSQSNLSNVYLKIKEKLNNGNRVLFSGTPCQVAGLYSFLGNKPDNLYTIDLICHGVPSSKILRKYLSDNYINSEIIKVDFRDKSVFGWSSEMNIYLKSGDEIHTRARDDSFYDAFLSNISLNPTCERCQFSRIPRQGDLSLGDFWNIENYNADLNDGKGTSLVLINNNKGKDLFDNCVGLSMTEDVPFDFVSKTVNMTVFRPFVQHPASKRFRDSFTKFNFNKLVSQCKSFHYDVGLVTTWFARNFGAIFTAYALYYFLECKGYSVLMLHKPRELWDYDYFDNNKSDIALRFGERNYQLSKIYSLENAPFIEKLNDHCDIFVLGSDQLWNPKVYAKKDYFFLDFVDSKKTKISYATSIGSNHFEGTYDERRRVKYLLKRFSSISNREDEAVDVLDNEFNVESTRVIDPVLLLDKSIYDDMVDSLNRTKDDSFIFAYILDGNETKKKVIDSLSKYLNMKVICAYDLEHADPSRYILNYPEADISSPEYWLWYIKNADYVVTDSYHGSCFSIIFNKLFFSFANQERGFGRFVELFDRLGLSDRLIVDEKFVLSENLINEEIDYSQTNKRIEEERIVSSKWLENAMRNHSAEMTAEEFILEKIKKKTEAEKKESLRNYSSIDQLGLHKGSTCQMIVDNMPENSYLQQVQGDFDPVSDTPLPYGVLTIKKTTNYFVEILFTQMTYRTKKPKIFLGNVVNCKLVGWTEFISKDSLSDVLKDIISASKNE